MECYLMSQPRAETLAAALRRRYGRRARRVDADAVRMYCVTTAEHEREPLDADWLEDGPVDEVAAWIDLDKLLGPLR